MVKFPGTVCFEFLMVCIPFSRMASDFLENSAGFPMTFVEFPEKSNWFIWFCKDAESHGMHVIGSIILGMDCEKSWDRCNLFGWALVCFWYVFGIVHL